MASLRLLLVGAAALVVGCGADEYVDEEYDAAGVEAYASKSTTSKHIFSIEHDLGDGFKKRNDVQYEGSMDLFSSKRAGRPDMKIQKVYFSPEEVSALEGLAKDGGFYRIRAPSSIKEDANTGAYVMSFVPACALIASRFTEHLVFHLGKEGEILGIDLSTPSSDCSLIKADLPKRTTKQKVVSTIKVDLGIEAEKPTMPPNWEQIGANSGGMDGKGGDSEGGEGKGGDKKPEEDIGFFRKYWYIWPFVLMYMMPSGEAAAGAGGAAPAGGGAKKK